MVQHQKRETIQRPDLQFNFRQQMRKSMRPEARHRIARLVILDRPIRFDFTAPDWHARVLGDPVRLRLLSILAAAEGGAVCVCDLTGPVERSQPTVSHHLKVLGDAGLVTGERRGRWVWYSLERDRLAALRATIDT